MLGTEAEVTFRFGTASRKRRLLTLRLRRWIELARLVEAPRLFVDGSFVTAKPEPGDVDAVIWLPNDFADRLTTDEPPALELESMLIQRRPEELFAAEDGRDWEDWLEFFGRTREADHRRKGVVEIQL